MSIQVIED